MVLSTSVKELERIVDRQTRNESNGIKTSGLEPLSLNHIELFHFKVSHTMKALHC